MDRELLLKMNPQEFDQSPKGWRSISNLGKNIEAASLINEYININKDRIDDLQIMYFHIGQLLAFTGRENYKEAVRSFKLSFYPNKYDLWNAYVSATIGFIENNIKKIEESINIVENSKKEDKRSGNLEIMKNLKESLNEKELDYKKAYSLSRG